MLYVLAITCRLEDNNYTSSIFNFTSKREALEKFYYEMYYATNQHIPYIIATLTDERGLTLKTEVFNNLEEN